MQKLHCSVRKESTTHLNASGFSYNLLTRTQNIVLEMQNGLRPEVDPVLCGRMAALYNFVYRRLVDANVNKDLEALNEALDVLEYQRETWALLLEKLAEEQGKSEQNVAGAVEGPEEGVLSLEG